MQGQILPYALKNYEPKPVFGVQPKLPWITTFGCTDNRIVFILQ